MLVCKCIVCVGIRRHTLSTGKIRALLLCTQSRKHIVCFSFPIRPSFVRALLLFVCTMCYMCIYMAWAVWWVHSPILFSGYIIIHWSSTYVFSSIHQWIAQKLNKFILINRPSHCFFQYGRMSERKKTQTAYKTANSFERFNTNRYLNDVYPYFVNDFTFWETAKCEFEPRTMCVILIIWWIIACQNSFEIRIFKLTAWASLIIFAGRHSSKSLWLEVIFFAIEVQLILVQCSWLL